MFVIVIVVLVVVVVLLLLLLPFLLFLLFLVELRVGRFFEDAFNLKLFKNPRFRCIRFDVVLR